MLVFRSNFNLCLMGLTEYSITESGLVEDLRRAGSDEYLSNVSEERLPSELL